MNFNRPHILPRRLRHRRHHGAIFIAALGVVIILSSMMLVFAQEMRVESVSSGNRLDAVQASAIELGAEAWVTAQVEANQGDPSTITQIPAEAIQVGDGYFWILHPDPDTDTQYDFGITDEAGKLNINTASGTSLSELPLMTDDIAASIINWRGGTQSTSVSVGNGATDDYYQSLPEPYSMKDSPFESVGELLLVKDMTPDILFGYDINRDGVINDAERQAGGTSSLFNGATASRGIFMDLTRYSVDANTQSTGEARVNVNNPDTSGLANALKAAGVSASRVNVILANVQPLVRHSGAFPDLGTFYTLSGITTDEFKKSADRLTATSAKTVPGLVDITTAPHDVLACLPGLTSSDADSLISARGNADTTSIGWVFDALSATKAAGILSSITARSNQYSADIVAVSGNGRAFKRVRIVVDTRNIPSKIIFRKDLTSLGWPLPPEIRTAMRSGQAPPTSNGGSGLGGSMSGLNQ